MVFDLHQVFGGMGHIVTEVVKTKFIVGSISNIRQVGIASLGAIGLVFVDAIDPEPVEFKKGGHPCAVSFGEVIVYGH